MPGIVCLAHLFHSGGRRTICTKIARRCRSTRLRSDSASRSQPCCGFGRRGRAAATALHRSETGVYGSTATRWRGSTANAKIRRGRRCPPPDLALAQRAYSLVRIGAGDGIRTRDLHLGKVPLYQLSHSRNPCRSRNDEEYNMAFTRLQIAQQNKKSR